MRRALGWVIMILFVACGSSDSDPGSTAGGPGAGGGTMQANPAGKKTPEEMQQDLLNTVAWTKSAPERDKAADGKACTDRVSQDPKLSKGAHPLVKIQHWMQCMEELGWTKKG